MKIKIEKFPNGMTRIEFAHDTSKKPMVVDLSPAKLELLLGMLQTAKTSNAFEFSLQLSK